MRRLIVGTILAVASLAGVAGLNVGTGYADEAKATCSLATLRGTYLFGGDVGLTIEGNDQIPSTAAGYEVYHGNGTMDFVASFSVNGEIMRGVRVSGKYTVNADCTGTATYTDGGKFDVFIAPNGSFYSFIQTNPGAVLSGIGQRVTMKQLGD